MITLQPINIVQAAADVVWSPVLRRFPDSTFALSEGGIGWDPVFPRARRPRLQAAPGLDAPELRQQAPERGLPRTRPHMLHRRRVRHREPQQAQPRHDHLGVRLPALRLDVAAGPETLGIYLDGVPDDEVSKITHDNALRLFSFDPFSHVPKEEATVSALRKQAIDVDLGYRSSSRLKKQGDDPVSVIDLATALPR